MLKIFLLKAEIDHFAKFLRSVSETNLLMAAFIFLSEMKWMLF